MPVLRVHTEDGAREFPFTPGASLRDILASGICGSGLVDIIASLRKAGILNGTGRLMPYGIPEENIRTMLAATYEFGSYRR